MISLEQVLQLDVQVAKVYDAWTSPDVAGQYGPRVVALAAAYEDFLTSDSDYEAHLNLAFVYWQSTEVGFNAATCIPLDFIRKSGERFEQVLVDLDKLYPGRPDTQFWKLYFDYMTLGDPCFEKECRSLIAMPRCSLIPYFYLFSISNSVQYKKQGLQLLASCEALPTLRNRYVASVIRAKLSDIPTY